MQALQGRLEEIFVESGLITRLRFSVTITNPNETPVEVIANTVSFYVSFPDGQPNLNSPTANYYVGEGSRDPQSSSLPKGAGQFSLYWSVSPEVMDEVEAMRGERDVIVLIKLNSTQIERTSQSLVGAQILTADVVDPRLPGNNFLALHIPKSRWFEVLTAAGFFNPSKVTSRSIRLLAQDARKAMREAENAATSAKELAEKVAVATLTSAYDTEATKLKWRSIGWLAAAWGVALGTAGLIGLYVYESLLVQFTVPQAIIRAAALLALAAFFGIVMKGYAAYRHLELLNRHRVNIGKTFEAFKNAQPSPAAKDLMAALTAQQMLNFGSNGFGWRDSKDDDQYVGLLRDLLTKVGSQTKP